MKKTFFTLLAIAGLLTTVDNSQAGLGWSYAECVEHYGQMTSPDIRMPDGSIACSFFAKGYDITAFFDTNTVGRISYVKDETFDTAGVEDFLTANGPGAIWTGPEKDDSNGSYRWHGTVDGAYAFSASLKDNGSTLVIWTKEDNDFGAAHNTQEASGM